MTKRCLPHFTVAQGADVIPSRRWRVIETNKDGKEREVLPAKIDAASQTKLAQRWVAWKKYIDVLVTSE